MFRIAAEYLQELQNNNPHTYDFVFREPLKNVSKVSLLSYSVPSTPLFTVVVASVAYSGTYTPAGQSIQWFDDRLIRDMSGDPSLGTTTMRLINPDRSVDLYMVDLFIVTKDIGGGQYQRFDILVCTGACEAQPPFTNWKIFPTRERLYTNVGTIQQDGDYNIFIALSGASSINVYTSPQPLVLHLQLQGPLQPRDARMAEWTHDIPDWKSYTLYYPNDCVTYNSVLYLCLTKHFAFEFDATMWRQVDSDNKSKGAMAVITPTYATGWKWLASRLKDCVWHDIDMPFVSGVRVMWRTPSGRNYIFPYSVEKESNNSNCRLYKSPVIHLKVE